MKSALTAVERDERTVAVENSSYRWSYQLLAFGVLLLVAIRGYRFDQNLWDFLLLVIISGALGAALQARAGILTVRWVRAALWCVTLAAGLAAAAAVSMAWLK